MHYVKLGSKRNSGMGGTEGINMVLFLLVATTSRFVGSLYCYSCMATNPNSDCENNVEMLTNAWKTRLFSKDCDLEVNETTCLIETTHSSGVLKTLIRDCSDGKTFSYGGIDRFANIVPTNQTTCSVFTGQMVCVTLCKRSFCNGPQPNTEKSFANGVQVKQAIKTVLTVVFLLLIEFSF